MRFMGNLCDFGTGNPKDLCEISCYHITCGLGVSLKIISHVISVDHNSLFLLRDIYSK